MQYSRFSRIQVCIVGFWLKDFVIPRLLEQEKWFREQGTGLMITVAQRVKNSFTPGRVPGLRVFEGILKVFYGQSRSLRVLRKPFVLDPTFL